MQSVDKNKQTNKQRAMATIYPSRKDCNTIIVIHYFYTLSSLSSGTLFENLSKTGYTNLILLQ